MNGKIFIAYTRSDSDYVSRLVDSLENRGLSIWTDERLVIGADWVQTIEENVKSCSALILIMSQSAYDSKWVQAELTLAMNYSKPIFPVLIEESQSTWLSVANIQYVDARDGKLPPDNFYERLSSVIFGKTISIEKTEVKKRPPKPYQGKRNFIFSSYKREEMEVIAQYLNHIVDWGYSVWYDAGIPGGADWLAMLETKVSNCKLMVVFLSPAAVDSQWVRNEVFLAISKEKPIVAIKLEEVELKHGLGLALVSTQFLKCWSSDFEEKLKTAIKYHM